MKKVAFAIAAHPDDIEFMMGGTMLLLAGAGYELHYMNVANGSCGTATISRDEIVVIRGREAQEAAASLGATFHQPLVDDLMIYYTPELVARLCAVLREVNPEILLLQSPQDYMEDHTNSSRLAVTAAFCRSMCNFQSEPPTETIDSEMAVYHCLPHGLADQLRNPVRAHFFVNVESVMARKRDALACHRSQKQWLDKTQGMDSYIKTAESLAAEVGGLSGCFEYAEGWRRHLHLGFGAEEFDPLTDALVEAVSQEKI